MPLAERQRRPRQKLWPGNSFEHTHTHTHTDTNTHASCIHRAATRKAREHQNLHIELSWLRTEPYQQIVGEGSILSEGTRYVIPLSTPPKKARLVLWRQALAELLATLQNDELPVRSPGTRLRYKERSSPWPRCTQAPRPQILPKPKMHGGTVA